MTFTDEIEPCDVNEQPRDDANDATDGDDDGGVKQIDPLANADEERQVRDQRQEQIEDGALARRQNSIRGLFAGVNLHHAVVDLVLLAADCDRVVGRALQAAPQFRRRLVEVKLALQQRLVLLAVHGKFEGVESSAKQQDDEIDDRGEKENDPKSA